MADNVPVTAGSGTSIGTDDVGGVHFQKVKVDLGGDGVSSPLVRGQQAMANSLPVAIASNQGAVPVDGSAVTQPISAASLPLPAGAATAAKQPALGTAGSASADVLSVQGVASMTALKVDASATTQPVSASALPLPTGASTAAKQPALGTAGSASADVITVQGVASMTALKVDGSAVTQPVSAASLPLPTGAATAAKQAALGTAGTPSADVLTVQGAASMTALKVDGSAVTQPVSGTVTASNATGAAAHDAAVSGNPILAGSEARTSDGTAVGNGDAVRTIADTLGKQVVLLGAVHDLHARGTANYTNTTAADLIAAAGAGVRIAVTSVLATNAHATVGTKVEIRDGTTAKIIGYAAPNGGGFALNAGGAPLFISTANTAVTGRCVTTGADVDITVSGYKIGN